ncbi:unnamed protein product [Caenorhabditis angaria]|uniref:C2H2-type domain-containing protein n=1 Tax=Caenorhabditis angaria TaxID=860376 RepID=A0A9P1IBF5_9PELO|nr:unnamed protein product [Caenorhabditis angaria]
MTYYSNQDVFFGGHDGGYIPQMSHYDFYPLAPPEISNTSTSSSPYWRTDHHCSSQNNLLNSNPAPWNSSSSSSMFLNSNPNPSSSSSNFGPPNPPYIQQEEGPGSGLRPGGPIPEKKPQIAVRAPMMRITPKPFRCHICCKAFSQAANLTAHKRIHTGEKPFMCSVCHRPFSQSSSLVTHRRTHTGERPYPCAQCDKAFTDSSTLTKHLRTHTGQKPYACPLCMMRFTQSGNLHRHMKTHK